MTFTAVKKRKFFNMESEQITTPEPEQKMGQSFLSLRFSCPFSLCRESAEIQV